MCSPSGGCVETISPQKEKVEVLELSDLCSFCDKPSDPFVYPTAVPQNSPITGCEVLVEFISIYMEKVLKRELVNLWKKRSL